MKKTEFKKIKSTELMKLLSEKREALRSFRFAVAGSKGKNVKEGSLLKKDIARILTALRSEQGK